MFGLGPWELALIFLVILLLFGAKRLPDIAQGLGKGIREFKRAVKDTQDEIKTNMNETEKKSKDSDGKKDG
ncbi:MAG: twin-arginine translocase TatA/TatE family subunit [Candidatus Zixiibacteriota bacterium]|nr:MAG: twin-arginine translocase TatA/TatE family subunit [candidate division Zixibacteria bacterium]